MYACITSARKCLELQDGKESWQARRKMFKYWAIKYMFKLLCWSPCDVSVGVSGCMFGQTRLSKCVLTWNEMRTSRNDPIRYATPPLSVTATLPEAVRRRQLDLTVRRGPHPFLLASSASPASAKDGGGGATKMARERLPCYACHRRTGQPH